MDARTPLPLLRLYTAHFTIVGAAHVRCIHTTALPVRVPIGALPVWPSHSQHARGLLLHLPLTLFLLPRHAGGWLVVLPATCLRLTTVAAYDATTTGYLVKAHMVAPHVLPFDLLRLHYWTLTPRSGLPLVPLRSPALHLPAGVLRWMDGVTV